MRKSLLRWQLMKKVVYLVGTLHKYQGCAPHTWRATKKQLEEFKDFLTQLIRRYDIRSIGEEMNSHELERYANPDLPAGESVPFQVARELNLRHKYCDPYEATRQRISDYDSDENTREVYWLKQLEDLDAFPCLFILGAAHDNTFLDRLKESGFEAVLLSKDWAPTSS